MKKSQLKFPYLQKMLKIITRVFVAIVWIMFLSSMMIKQVEASMSRESQINAILEEIFEKKRIEWREKELKRPLTDFDIPTRIEKIRNEFRLHGLAEWEIDVFVELARLESTYNDKAYNNLYGASGLYQILSMTWNDRNCEGDVWNWRDNIACTVRIYRQYGFGAWEAYNIYY